MVPIGVLIPFLPPHFRGFEQEAIRAITPRTNTILPKVFICMFFILSKISIFLWFLLIHNIKHQKLVRDQSKLLISH